MKNKRRNRTPITSYEGCLLLAAEIVKQNAEELIEIYEKLKGLQDKENKTNDEVNLIAFLKRKQAELESFYYSEDYRIYTLHKMTDPEYVIDRLKAKCGYTDRKEK